MYRINHITGEIHEERGNFFVYLCSILSLSDADRRRIRGKTHIDSLPDLEYELSMAEEDEELEEDE